MGSSPTARTSFGGCGGIGRRSSRCGIRGADHKRLTHHLVDPRAGSNPVIRYKSVVVKKVGLAPFSRGWLMSDAGLGSWVKMASLVYSPIVGDVSEWSKEPDCKSGDLMCLRKFESSRLHQAQAARHTSAVRTATWRNMSPVAHAPVPSMRRQEIYLPVSFALSRAHQMSEDRLFTFVCLPMQ